MTDVNLMIIFGIGFVLSSLFWIWLANIIRNNVGPLTKKLEESEISNEELQKKLTHSDSKNQELQNKLVETDLKLTELTRENKNLQGKLSETNTKLDSCTNALSQ